MDLFTVRVFRADKVKIANSPISDTNEEDDSNQTQNVIGDFPNMVSARVIQGKTIELQHSNLVDDVVKFKTVINYSRSLEKNASLGVALTPQRGYVSKREETP